MSETFNHKSMFKDWYGQQPSTTPSNITEPSSSNASEMITEDSLNNSANETPESKEENNE